METTTRTNQTLSLGELASQHSMNSFTEQILGVNNKIFFAREFEKMSVTETEMRRNIGLVCVSHGIKELPADPIVFLCLKFWHEKYALRMNQKELELAFELNLSGDLGEKVHHYQLFSVEFFCDVLNKYLLKKAEAVAKSTQQQSEPKPVGPKNMTPQMLVDILTDFETLNHPDATVKEQLLPGSFATVAKLNLLSRIIEIDISEDRIAALREKARWNLVRELSAKKVKLNENKFGAAVSLGHQIARLKTGKLITQTDEDHLQAEVTRLLYIQTLQLIKPSPGQDFENCVFVRAVQEFEKLEAA